MRRTTICRSNRAVLLALVAVPLACWSLPAQDTTQAEAPPPALAQEPLGELPATHTVAAGETLWSLAQVYFHDPLLWPEIYRLNTALIEDPHWIYPGEVLNVSSVSVAHGAIPQGAGADTVQEPILGIPQRRWTRPRRCSKSHLRWRLMNPTRRSSIAHGGVPRTWGMCCARTRSSRTDRCGVGNFMRPDFSRKGKTCPGGA